MRYALTSATEAVGRVEEKEKEKNHYQCARITDVQRCPTTAVVATGRFYEQRFLHFSLVIEKCRDTGSPRAHERPNRRVFALLAHKLRGPRRK